MIDQQKQAEMDMDTRQHTSKAAGGGTDSAPYLLECFNGGTFYVPINNADDLRRWRNNNPEIEGDLYTHDGHLVDEETI